MRNQLLVRNQLLTNSSINSFRKFNRHGKDIDVVTGNTRIGDAIRQLPVNHFGSVRDYDIDTLPLSYVKCKGTEITWVSSKAKEFKGKYMISRRFLSRLLQKWCYLVGMRYINRRNPYASTGINLWTKTAYLLDEVHMNVKEIHMLTGNDGIYMLRDFMFLIRNKSYDKIFKNISYAKVSPHLWEILMETALSNKKEFEVQLAEIKNRLNYDYQVRNKAWGFPKWNSEMLEGYIQELDSGEYILDMGVPIIHDLWNYPIKCTSINELRKVDDVMDDYDIGNYLWERN